MDAPLPIAPAFTFLAMKALPATAGPTTRSTPAHADAPAAALPAAPPATSIPSVSNVRALTADKKNNEFCNLA
eukprot:6210615-Pleurochrysis_carterae.AAC.2